MKREYTYGLDERLFTSEHDRDRNKRRFNDLMKKLDAEVRVNDSYLHEMKAIKKLKSGGLSSLFSRKVVADDSGNPEKDFTIEEILKKQGQNRL